jgi:hypothetical protein
MSGLTVEVPIINLNGSSPKTMVADIRTALDALRLAAGAVAQTAPHPRDWQTVPDGGVRWRLARDHHVGRMRRLADIHEELTALGVAIQEQADARTR